MYCVMWINSIDHIQYYSKKFLCTTAYHHRWLKGSFWLSYALSSRTIFNIYIIQNLYKTCKELVTWSPEDDNVWKCDFNSFKPILAWIKFWLHMWMAHIKIRWQYTGLFKRTQSCFHIKIVEGEFSIIHFLTKLSLSIHFSIRHEGFIRICWLNIRLHKIIGLLFCPLTVIVKI